MYVVSSKFQRLHQFNGPCINLLLYYLISRSLHAVPGLSFLSLHYHQSIDLLFNSTFHCTFTLSFPWTIEFLSVLLSREKCYVCCCGMVGAFQINQPWNIFAWLISEITSRVCRLLIIYVIYYLHVFHSNRNISSSFFYFFFFPIIIPADGWLASPVIINIFSPIECNPTWKIKILFSIFVQ